MKKQVRFGLGLLSARRKEILDSRLSFKENGIRHWCMFSKALKSMRKWIWQYPREKWKKLERHRKRLFRKFSFRLITFCTCSVAMKVDLFLALLFALLRGMLIGVDKRAGSWHAVNDEEYGISKQLGTQKFVKPVKEQSRKEKSALIKFWRPKEK